MRAQSDNVKSVDRCGGARVCEATACPDSDLYDEVSYSCMLVAT
jgi:hypothetical protein